VLFKVVLDLASVDHLLLAELGLRVQEEEENGELKQLRIEKQ
jgi:hypothetical protein